MSVAKLRGSAYLAVFWLVCCARAAGAADGGMSEPGYWITFLHKHGDNFATASGRIIIILGIFFAARIVIFKVISGVVRLPITKDMEVQGARKARVYALQTVLRSAAGFVLGFVLVIMLLQAAGINIYPLLTTAGVAGLAVGMGAQKLVRDVINGFFILMEDQYGVGDHVTIGLVTGAVEELGMRTTRIRDGAGKLYILSNGDIAQVCNHSRGKLRMTLDVALASSSDLDKARQVLDGVGQAMAKDMPELVEEPFRCEGFTQITGAAATMRLAGSVTSRHQDRVQMELNTRIRDALQRDGIPLA